jgi:hypothetical protein
MPVKDEVDENKIEEVIDQLPVQETGVYETMESIEEAWLEYGAIVKMEIKIEEEKVEVEAETEANEKSIKEVNVGSQMPMAPEEYVICFGQVSRKQERLGFEKTFAALMGQYQWPDTSQQDKLVQAYLSDHKMAEKIERTYSRNAMLFQKAMNDKSEEAMKALNEEVIKVLKINIWIQCT